ncbi:WXG100 family type VII secretion target [Agromyces sp. NPDC056379]|uniref:WXG100 family type VII secretion target n=1 Tax=unclassified Agromyces TaxID=2639701 RepID=UPI0035D90A64
MAEQQADVSELQALVQTMGELVAYCSALKQGASGFAYMLPNEWQGPAMQAFLGTFEAWAVGATSLEGVAESLRQQVETSHNSYSSTIEKLTTDWSSIEANLG